VLKFQDMDMSKEEKLGEKEGLMTSVESTIRKVNNRSRIRA